MVALPAMTRRRPTIDRPHHHLMLAAQAHARHVAGDPHPDDITGPDSPAAETPEQPQRTRSQRRDVGGRFT